MRLSTVILTALCFAFAMSTYVWYNAAWEALGVGQQALELFQDYQHNLVEACNRPEGFTVHIVDKGQDRYFDCLPSKGI